MRPLFTFVFLCAFGQAAIAQSLKEMPALAHCFRDQDAVGAFVMLDRATNTLFASDEARARERFVPASTFKIANSLIGLDTGAVKDVEEVLPYGGKPQRIKAWEHDMNLRDAIKASNVAVYRELARRIGLDRMRAGVHKLGYGNTEIGEKVDAFWLDGPLKISAVEQTQFLSRLIDEKLPVRAEAMRAVKEITLLEKTDAYQLHGKTGWYWPDDGAQQIGWFVGWVVRGKEAFPFALNLDVHQDADAEKRIPIARACLQTLGKLPR